MKLLLPPIKSAEQSLRHFTNPAPPLPGSPTAAAAVTLSPAPYQENPRRSSASDAPSDDEESAAAAAAAAAAAVPAATAAEATGGGGSGASSPTGAATAAAAAAAPMPSSAAAAAGGGAADWTQEASPSAHIFVATSSSADSCYLAQDCRNSGKCRAKKTPYFTTTIRYSPLYLYVV